MFLGKSRVAVSASSCHGWELNSAPRSAEGVERCGGWGWGESGRKLVLARQPDWGWHEPPPPKMDGRDDICSLWGDFSPPSFTLAEKSRNPPGWGNWGGESKNRNLSNWNQTRRRQNRKLLWFDWSKPKTQVVQQKLIDFKLAGYRLFHNLWEGK